MSWRISRLQAPASELHGRAITWSERSATFCDTTRPALVLGSTQPFTDADTATASAAGVDVVRRRGGGGAVLLEPARTVWADVVVPTGDPLWQADVGRAFWWLGDVWAAALGAVGMGKVTVHRGPLVTSRWSRLVCFAGVGPGEVSAGGGKVVGISQRRVREGALFQCAVPLAWDAAAIPALLDLEPLARAALEAESSRFVGTLPHCTRAQLQEAFVSHLPRS